jgi:hypothetical protein
VTTLFGFHLLLIVFRNTWVGTILVGNRVS